jgi:uncharacterized membrane protein
MDVAVATFSGVSAAELAFAGARDRDPGRAWLGDVAFVEVHRRGRIVVRGTVLGHYVDVDGMGDAMGDDTAAGAIAGAAVGFPFGPPAFAVGLVAGATAGGVVEASHIPKSDGPAFDAIRDQVPEGSSAIVLFSDEEAIRAMYDQLAATADTFVHYRLSPTAEAELRSAVAAAPPATPRDPSGA